MKMLLALLLFTSAGPAELEAQRADARLIVRVVLAQGAKAGRAAGECVSAEMKYVTFQPLRRVWRERVLPNRDDRSAPHGPAGFIGDNLSWEPVPRPPVPRGGRFPELAGEDAKVVAYAVGAIVDGPEPPRLLDRVDPAWLPAHARFCDTGDQLRSFQISSPTIVGDIAFVGVDHLCPLCGYGGTYALRRSGGEWRIFAYSAEWVS